MQTLIPVFFPVWLPNSCSYISSLPLIKIIAAVVLNVPLSLSPYAIVLSILLRKISRIWDLLSIISYRSDLLRSSSVDIRNRLYRTTANFCLYTIICAISWEDVLADLRIEIQSTLSIDVALLSHEFGGVPDWILFWLPAVLIWLSQMDKRSWPWKRKSSSDKAAAAEKAAAILDLAATAAASGSSKSQSDQVRFNQRS